MSLRKILLVVAILAWSASLFLPATASYDGLSALIAGIFAWLVDPVWGLAWTANILFFVGVMLGFLSRKSFPPQLLAGLALACCLVSFIPDEIIVNEGGGTEPNVLGAGFYVWLLAHVILLASSFFPNPSNDQQPEIQFQ